MGSPFPGMDPWLEDAELWPDFHQRLITYLADGLNAHMPERYFAQMQERVYVVRPDRHIWPDVSVKKRRTKKPMPGRSAAPLGATAVMDPPTKIVLGPEEFREPFIELRSSQAGGNVVSVIEVLSPSNKDSRGKGKREYVKKQKQVLATTINLLEIDLLLRGDETTVVLRELLRRRQYCDYHVSLSRGFDRSVSDAWPIILRDRLPRIGVPLAGDDGDVVIDLQATFERVYDQGAYARHIEYARNPPVPLPPSDMAWANALLRKQGFRK